MKLTGIRQMEMTDIPTPGIRHDSDVLIRMHTVGVCGSDVHYYETGQIGSQVVSYPFAVGHEGSGIVEAVGKAVTRVKSGDRIAIEPAISCFKCDQCLAGRPHTCRKLLFLGCPGQVEGCLSEHIVMPEASCFPIPDAMSFEQAALSEPLSIGLYAVKRSVPMPGARIAILGSGPIGLSVLLIAKAQGAGEIYVTDKIDSRLDLARKFSSGWTGNPEKQDIVKEILSCCPGGVDAVFECCGQQEALDQAVDLLAPGGKLMLIGIPPTLERVAFHIDTLRRQELCIQNVRRQNHCVQPALDMIESGKIDVDAMVTHHFPFEDTRTAFDLVSDYSDGVVKAIIHMS